jgi:hypothetical protein
MQIKRTIKGHTFSVQLRAVERAGQLANGAPAYAAHVTIYRDGRDIGSAGWGGECFVHGPPAMADVDDSEDVYRELAVAIREHLATLPVETRADEATTSMQRVTFAPGLRGDELRCMASTARLTASRMTGVSSLQSERRAWVALAEALDAAADRDERTARAPASPPAESPAPELERVDFTAEQDGDIWTLRAPGWTRGVQVRTGGERYPFGPLDVLCIKWGETCPPKPIEVWLERKGGA